MGDSAGDGEYVSCRLHPLMKISIVTSLYRSSPYVREFYDRHLACIKKLGIDYEFVFVDDGSPDDSAAKVETLMTTEPNIKLISFSRNFGQQAAMLAGLEGATGDWVYAVDSDLEEPPENILPMMEILRGDPKADVVYGVLEQRTGGLVRAVFGKAFYVLLDLLSSVRVPHDQAWQRIMSRRYVNALLLYRESETLFAGIMTLTGFKQIPFQISKTYKGQSSYSFSKRLILALNALISFSSRPMIFICLLGLGATLISGLAITTLVIAKLTLIQFQAGWASLIASIWCVGGLILTSVGVTGIYISKIFNQVKSRPRYIVRSISQS